VKKFWSEEKFVYLPDKKKQSRNQPKNSVMKKHNFYAGPSILSPYTIKNTADAVINFADTGLSLLEVSHRSKEFVAVMDEAQALVKELLDEPVYEIGRIVKKDGASVVIK
jgi:chromosomal replication initiation ATPase DnaA